MSWGKEQFKKAYNRAQSGRQETKDLDDEMTSMYWADYFVRDDYDNGPSIEQLKVAYLLSMLSKLKIR
jgi:hypothetical protein